MYGSNKQGDGPRRRRYEVEQMEAIVSDWPRGAAARQSPGKCGMSALEFACDMPRYERVCDEARENKITYWLVSGPCR